MRKILIRAGMSPMVNHSPVEVLGSNLIGNNLGNMLFPYSVSRCLMTEDAEIHALTVQENYSKAALRKIDENYDCLILPFANAFRISFVEELKTVTRLVRGLHIPCIVVGIGAQANLDKQPDNEELAQAAREFVEAVLEKSAKIGLRGEFTANYLEGLGFRAERDFTVIGCPSMYLYGGRLPEMQVKPLTKESSVSINSKIQLPQKFHNFMYRSRKSLPDFHYVPQVIQEICMMYQGQEMPGEFAKKLPGHFPVRWDDEIYAQGKSYFFTNVPAWLKYLEGKDFSFGSRIHGNIAAILAGTPCFIVVSDQRIRELAEYHGIPHILMEELKKETSIFQLHEQADFAGIARGHQARFGHYLDFLHENGLETVFDQEMSPEVTPFDRKIETAGFEMEGLLPLACLDEGAQRERLREMGKDKIFCQKVRKYLRRKRLGMDTE